MIGTIAVVVSLAQDQRFAWNAYFTGVFTDGGERLSIARWEELRCVCDASFWNHVGKSLYTEPK